MVSASGIRSFGRRCIARRDLRNSGTRMMLWLKRFLAILTAQSGTVRLPQRARTRSLPAGWLRWPIGRLLAVRLMPRFRRSSARRNSLLILHVELCACSGRATWQASRDVSPQAHVCSEGRNGSDLLRTSMQSPLSNWNVVVAPGSDLLARSDVSSGWQRTSSVGGTVGVPLTYSCASHRRRLGRTSTTKLASQLRPSFKPQGQLLTIHRA